MNDAIDTMAKASREALERIAPLIRRTPLDYSETFSQASGAEVFLKLENLQHTGSFKLRGASNRLRTLPAQQLERGCVAASSGNHGAAVACALGQLDAPGIIFVPEQTSAAKVDAIRRYGGDVRFFGTDGLDTEQHARAFATQNGMFYLSPYNDWEVIAGQGTCGLEIQAQQASLDAVFIAVGGGGLASGVGSVMKAANPALRVIGCQPAASAVMAESVAAGRILDLPSAPTLSDGTAGGIEAGSITFDLCRRLIDEFVVVDEAAIADAMRRFQDAGGRPIEGAAGVAIAAMLASRERIQGQRVAVIVCGGNVSRETLATIGPPACAS